MNRRKFLAVSLSAPLAARLALPSMHAHSIHQPTFLPSWHQFLITTSIGLPNVAGSAELWVPIAQTSGGYQISLNLAWETNGLTECVYDARYGTPMLRTTWNNQESTDRHLRVDQIVAVRDRSFEPFSKTSSRATIGSPSLISLTEAERKFWTSPTESIPLDGMVLATADRITSGKTASRERLRAIYDWVVDNTRRDDDVPGCGTGDIKGMLEHRKLEGKCADINGLMVGLARAAGFPARDVYGIRVAPSKQFPSVGTGPGSDISKAQHCRAEIFLDDEGWFPIDPADVVKVITAEKLASTSPEAILFREHQFGNWEMNWIGYNSATDIELPAMSSGRQKLPFFMYPCAFIARNSYSGIDPTRFSHYEMTVRREEAF